MNTTRSSIEKLIIENVKMLTQTKTFTKWLGAEKIADGDLVLINNSFIYRSQLIKTKKKPVEVTPQPVLEEV